MCGQLLQHPLTFVHREINEVVNVASKVCRLGLFLDIRLFLRFFCFFFGFLAGPPIRSVRLTAVPGLRSAHQVFRVDKVTSQLIAVQF